MTRSLLLAAAGCAALAALGAGPALAAPAAKAHQQCFYARNVDNFTPVDERTVNIRVGVKDVYQLDLFAPCNDLKWNETIAIRSRGSSWICSGLDVELISPTPIGPQRCPVRSLRKLTPEEVAALPAKQRP